MPGHDFGSVAIHSPAPAPSLAPRGSGTDAGPAPASVGGLLRADAGAPLDATTRAWAQPWLGHDLGAVRVHASAAAQLTARAAGAAAYTVGQHIVFAAGEYAPGTAAGRRLLAHELVHTVQQGDVADFDALRIAGPDDDAEREAEAIAAGGPFGRVQGERAAPARGRATLARATDSSGPGPAPSGEDQCEAYERDENSLSWSIMRQVYRKLGRTWPGMGKVTCESTDYDFCPISCEVEMNDGLLGRYCLDTAKNKVSAGLIEVRDGIRHIKATCDFTYTCPTPSQIEFSGGCTSTRSERSAASSR